VQELLEKSRKLLKLPPDYLIGTLPGNQRGAFETALWNFLDPTHTGVDVFYWTETEGSWMSDVVSALASPRASSSSSSSNEEKYSDFRHIPASRGRVPDWSLSCADRDTVVSWCSEDTGGRVPAGAECLKPDRVGLVLCDATAAVFSCELPWDALDVVTYTGPPALGAESNFGVVVLSPRAVQRLNCTAAPLFLPQLYSLRGTDNKCRRDLFHGTGRYPPPVLCVEAVVEALDWANSVGGLDGLVRRSKANLRVLEEFVDCHDWIHFSHPKASRCSTSVCLNLDLPAAAVKAMCDLLERERVAFGISAAEGAPPGLRIWCGGTVEAEDVELLTHWLGWAYEEARGSFTISA